MNSSSQSASLTRSTPHCLLSRGFGGFEGEYVKILCSNPKRQKGTTLREYASVGASHVKISSTA